ncbi:MAG: hypothetical protein ACK5IN_09045 [Microbacterium sp.]|uniref:hypothetical protein n=1 Tax=Microbacterium sp. TaxID=51671 RepID=UPI003A89E2D1
MIDVDPTEWVLPPGDPQAAEHRTVWLTGGDDGMSTPTVHGPTARLHAAMARSQHERHPDTGAEHWVSPTGHTVDLDLPQF